MITYIDNVNDLNPDMLTGFFSGWKNYPSSEKHLTLLQNSEYIILALDDEKNKVAGFINAISDGVLSAYIPLIEVLPEYQRCGIGSELVKRMMEKLKDYYMIDIVCDEDLQKFYEKSGLQKYTAMIKRNYDKQSGN